MSERFCAFSFEELKFFSRLLNSYRLNNSEEKLGEDIKKEIDETLSSLPKPTLREYLESHAIGAYHHFYFYIGTNVDVIGVSDFCKYYKENILDEWEVWEDNYCSNGGDCCSFRGEHRLDVRRIEKNGSDSKK